MGFSIKSNASTGASSRRRQSEILSREDLSRYPQWAQAFGSKRKDRRYYELVEDTINPEFKYGYFGLREGDGSVSAFQPFFIVDQDILPAPIPGSHLWWEASGAFGLASWFCGR